MKKKSLAVIMVTLVAVGFVVWLFENQLSTKEIVYCNGFGYHGFN